MSEDNKAAEIAVLYVQCINAHDVEALFELMADDFQFLDSGGTRLEGKAAMRQAWKGYFDMFPDYHICAEEWFARVDTVAILGWARGTYAVDGALDQANFWQIPAAWKAVVRDGLISLWQVYADNYPVWTIIKGAGAGR